MKIETADKHFSIYIRLRDSDENGYAKCCSCGKVSHWKDSDAGHFVNRAHKSLRFSEVNVNTQCRHCNRFREGNVTGYAMFMIDKYGRDILEKLEITKNKTHKMGKFELKAIADFYKSRNKELIKLKNFSV